MKPAVTIKTKFGLEFYKAVSSDFHKFKIQDNLSELKRHIFSERSRVEKQILHLLDDPDMIKQHRMDDEDVSGWHQYTELSDQFSTLNHFYNRK